TQSAYARAEPTRSQTNNSRLSSCCLFRPGKCVSQLSSALLTHISTSRPAGTSLGSPATRSVISFIRCSSLLRCKCTNQVNLFSHPLYSLNSMTHPHFQTTTHALTCPTQFGALVCPNVHHSP